MRHLCLLLHLHFPSASVSKPGKDNNEERGMEDEETSGSQLARMALQVLLALLVLVRCKLFSILYFLPDLTTFRSILLIRNLLYVNPY